MHERLRLGLVATALVFVACGGDASTPSQPTPARPAVAATTDPVADGGVETGGGPSGPMDGAGASAPDGATDETSPSLPNETSERCKAPESCAALVGFVKRTSTKPKNGGKGPIYVAVFDGNPVTEREKARVVAVQLIADADMSAKDAAVAYRIEGVPVRPDAYHMFAFLDDNHTASEKAPTPDKGDLCSIQMSLGNFGGVRAVVDKPLDTTVDIELNMVMP